MPNKTFYQVNLSLHQVNYEPSDVAILTYWHKIGSDLDCLVNNVYHLMTLK